MELNSLSHKTASGHHKVEGYYKTIIDIKGKVCHKTASGHHKVEDICSGAIIQPYGYVTKPQAVITRSSLKAIKVDSENIDEIGHKTASGHHKVEKLT